MVASVSAHMTYMRKVCPELMAGNSLLVTHQEPTLSYNPVRTIGKNLNLLSDSLPGAIGDLGADTLRAATAKNNLPEPPSIPKAHFIVDRLIRKEKSSPENRNSDTSIPADLRNTSGEPPVSNFQELEANPANPIDKVLNRLKAEGFFPENAIPPVETKTKQSNFLQQIANSIGNLFSKTPLSSPTARTKINSNNHSKTAPRRELSIEKQKALGKLQQAKSNLGINDGVFEFA